MPVTITPAPPAGIFGWGISMHVSSDFIGPLPTGSFWLTKVTVDSEENSPLVTQRTTAVSQTADILLGSRFDTSVLLSAQVALRDGDTAWVRSELHSPTATLDTSITSAPWSNTAGMRQMISQLLAQQPTGGLTATQATQLQETHDHTQLVVQTPTGDQTVGLGQLLSLPTLDALTLVEDTSGPTPNFASADLPKAAIGIIVRITTVGPGYAPTCPDDGYYVPELAVINFFRGTDLLQRIGMHTVSRFIYPLPGAWDNWMSTLFGGDLPPDYSVQVTFAAGNLGQLFHTRLP